LYKTELETLREQLRDKEKDANNLISNEHLEELHNAHNLKIAELERIIGDKMMQEKLLADANDQQDAKIAEQEKELEELRNLSKQLTELNNSLQDSLMRHS
ncbi:15468_t:CDS:2, partial [Acaulospora morrowiae]